MKFGEVPQCTRGGHWCAELCPIAHGQPCKPPDGHAWQPRGGAQRGSAVWNYRLLRNALPSGELTETQERYLRWLAGWDGDTTEAVESLLRLGRETKWTDETPEADLEALRFARDIILTHNARVAETAALRASHPQCANCGNPAACLGSYESNDAWAYACGDCCAHGNEDGCCFPLAEVPARYQALVAREAAEEEELATSLARMQELEGMTFAAVLPPIDDEFPAPDPEPALQLARDEIAALLRDPTGDYLGRDDVLAVLDRHLGKPA